MLRHAVNQFAIRMDWTEFPYGTLLINVLGSLVMGFILGSLAARGATTSPLRLFLTTGVIGGFTTFSAFSLETVLLFERGRITLAVSYVLASVVLAALGLATGLAVTRVSP